MNKFEATLVLNPDLSKQAIIKELDSFKKMIEDSKGLIKNSEDWGLRDLSYKINNYKKAFYNFFQVEISGEKISKLQNILNQNEKILRYLFVKVEDHEELPTKIKNEEK